MELEGWTDAEMGDNERKEMRLLKEEEGRGARKIISEEEVAREVEGPWLPIAPYPLIEFLLDVF